MAHAHLKFPGPIICAHLSTVICGMDIDFGRDLSRSGERKNNLDIIATSQIADGAVCALL
jgi:hypothetical protein